MLVTDGVGLSLSTAVGRKVGLSINLKPSSNLSGVISDWRVERAAPASEKRPVDSTEHLSDESVTATG